MSPHLNRKKTGLAAKAFVAAALSFVASPSSAGPFSDLSGYWTGGGNITMSSGSSERIRCKATYAVNDSGNSLNQSIRCASDSYRLEITANVTVSGGSISGSWTEATRHATGNLSGRASCFRNSGAGRWNRLLGRAPGALPWRQAVGLDPADRGHRRRQCLHHAA